MERVCIRPFKSDYEALRRMAQADANISLNGLIRAILRSYVRNMRALENTKLDGTETITLDENLIQEIINSEEDLETETETETEFPPERDERILEKSPPELSGKFEDIKPKTKAILVEL